MQKQHNAGHSIGEVALIHFRDNVGVAKSRHDLPTMGTHESQGSDQTPVAFRKPQRISVTIPHTVYRYLLTKSDCEGRSLSNLASHLLERFSKEA